MKIFIAKMFAYQKLLYTFAMSLSLTHKNKTDLTNYFLRKEKQHGKQQRKEEKVRMGHRIESHHCCSFGLGRCIRCTSNASLNLNPCRNEIPWIDLLQGFVHIHL